MPTSLPDPVLALSMDNVLKMNDLNLDQLANLWNVFTKCAESLESGRRLENLSWRLWFREAHILPPDTSLSDLTDFTPLDTPLISRANSITGSYKPVRLSSSAVAPRSSSALSDPEDGNDSDYSTDSASDAASTSTAPAPSVPASAPVKRRVKLDPNSRPSTPSSSTATTLGPSTALAKSPRAAASQKIAESIAERTSRAMTAASRRINLAEIDADGSKRKRGISSSSAFGSKARVKQRNQEGASRRRPLSFQAALENLVLTSRADNFASLRGKQGSMPLLDAHMNASTGALDAPRNRYSHNNTIDDGETNSAPAELSPIKSSSIAQAAFASHIRNALESSAANVSTTPVSPKASRIPVDDQHCNAPETRGPISPTKMPVALAPTIGAISRQGSQTTLSDAATVQAASVSAPRESKKADAETVQAYSSSQQLVPPPQGLLPQPTPAASALKQQAQAEQHASSPAQAQAAVPAEHHEGTHTSVGMVRSDSTSSASTQASHRSTASGAGVRRTSEARIRTRGSAGGLHAGHRSKSSTGLRRAAKHSKSSDGIAGAPARPAPRHNLLSGLAMTRAAPEPAPTHAVARKPVPQEHPAPKAPAPAPKKAPVKFTMGGDETDSEDYEDESSDDADAAKAAPAPPAAERAPAKTEAPADKSKNDADNVEVADDDDDEWASDSEAEEQERRARQAAEAEQRKRREEERHKSMFQKQPIRSKSAADLRLLAPHQTSTAGPSPPVEPVRGLLSSLFHPDEQHSPPGQLAGRPHASAANLRTNPSMSSRRGLSEAATSPLAVRRTRAHRDSNDSTSHAPRSLREGGFAGLTGLTTSKSAVALPLLDTHITRSSTGGKAKHEEQNVAGGSHHSDGSASSPESPVAAASFGRPGSMALARLHALTNIKAHSKRDSTSNDSVNQPPQAQLQRQKSSVDVQLDREASSRSLRLEVSPDDRDFAIPSRASLTNLANSQPRQSAPSLASRHSDQQPHSRASQRDALGSGSRSNSEGLPSGHGSMQQSAAGSMNGPVSISRPRSSLNLPEAAAPQTPRTTRRNMLRDELSESLRQNLLWERQSRTRMMGIGAPMAPLNQAQAQTSAPAHRRDNVLNGNVLRPLTSTGTPRTESRNGGEPKPKRYSEEWGSFHHKGW
ncbi:uncharacterized protein SPSC_02659 [Sporisorium scitamineum]|uniref:Nitrogen regulatory protein areA GATA-like domain-containing protein n=1 Tax=Sporisorium scitamineum TaxID=49012 RepID=A0A0F7RUW0_9BASI|nr:hypothetical protein [Sporisorium scitamineum]CDU24030.1 uncharacterized protein SPSC_02659 [Sporisorium scitamineum]